MRDFKREAFRVAHLALRIKTAMDRAFVNMGVPAEVMTARRGSAVVLFVVGQIDGSRRCAYCGVEIDTKPPPPPETLSLDFDLTCRRCAPRLKALLDVHLSEWIGDADRDFARKRTP